MTASSPAVSSASAEEVSTNTDQPQRSRWPLRARLVVVLVVLLSVGLIGSGVTVRLVLGNVLMGQVDQELRQTSANLASMPIEELILSEDATPVLPSRYLVAIELEDGRNFLLGNTNAGTPDFPDDDITSPVTVDDVESERNWRIETHDLQLTQAGAQIGTLTLAVPLDQQDRTLEDTTQIIILTALGVIIIAAVAASALVRRELRGLKTIERTAVSIAAGHLHRRVPPGPPGTEVGSLSSSLNAMLAQIEQSFSARADSEQKMRRFISDASHELRTPLATIRGYGELYRMGGVPEKEVGNAMERIESEASRMGGLVEDLLALARLDEHATITLEDVDLDQVAHDAIRDLGALDPTREAKVATTDDDPVIIRADNAAVRQVLSNLLGNAIRHTPEGTPVEVIVGRREIDGRDMGLIAVCDHGPGVPPEDAARIFSRFYRIDPSRNRSLGGSGLGLAIVTAAAKKHEGEVRLVETPGGGATFEVAFPVDGPLVGGGGMEF